MDNIVNMFGEVKRRLHQAWTGMLRWRGRQAERFRLAPLQQRFHGWLLALSAWFDRQMRHFRFGAGEQDLALSIRPYLHFGLAVAGFTLLFFVGWGGIAPLDSAAVAPGSVVVASNRKTIQHLEGGIITDILVKDGDKVEAGQELVRLNATSAKARREMVTGKLLSARAAEARLVAMRDGKETIEVTEGLKALQEKEDYQQVIAGQQGLFETRRKAYLGEIQVLDQRILQLEEKITGIQAQKAGTEKQLSLIAEEIETTSKLLEKGLSLKSRLLALQREEASLQGQIGSFVSEITNTQERIGETKIQKLNRENEYQKEVATEMKDVQQEIAGLEEQLSASSDVFERTVITAPQAGTVTGLKYHTVGGVIAPGTAIMDLVPQDDMLMIEVRIQPQDIDAVHPGLEAKVRLSAYRSRMLPRLSGKVEYVSADRFIDEKAQMAYYLGRVRIDEDEMRKLAGKVELYPGMPAEVFIVTGSRTLLEYLGAPLIQSFQRSLVED